MTITPVAFHNFIPTQRQTNTDEPCILVAQFCKSFKLPDEKRKDLPDYSPPASPHTD